MYWFTADEHYFHKNIIKYCNRPFDDVYEMNNALVDRNNEVVSDDDIVFHLGDFILTRDVSEIQSHISKLNGNHIFLKGSHDKWLSEDHERIKILEIEGIIVVLSHYAMRVWHRSHYNSWHLYGHSHGKLLSQGKSIDVGVDCHDYYPYSFDEIKNIMKTKPNNLDEIVIGDRFEEE